MNKEIPSGFPELDSYTGGFKRGDFIVIASRPAVGKSTLALEMISNICLKKNISTGLFSLESFGNDVIQYLNKITVDVPEEKVSEGIYEVDEYEQRAKTSKSISEGPLFINDTRNIELDELIADIKEMKRKEDIEIVFIDYLGLIQLKNNNATRKEQLNTIAYTLKQCAKELDIPIIALSQLGVNSEKLKPSLSDFRDSISIEKHADLIILLHKGEQNNRELIIAKNRNGQVGNIGI